MENGKKPYLYVDDEPAEAAPLIASDLDAGYYHGRGAQRNTPNPYHAAQAVLGDFSGIDIPFEGSDQTILHHEKARQIINEVKSPDIPFQFSANPYQGCEHGCVYCYARNTHQYWGYSAGLDFERRIIVKSNAAELLESEFRKKSWKPQPVMLSGNTDCYQPVERKLRITMRMLEVFQKFRNPVGLITKNSLITRDIAILQDLAVQDLVHVAVSITCLDEKLRRRLEPRTSTTTQRLHTIEALARAGIPVTAMISPVIPGLNSHEVPEIMRLAADAGAKTAGYSLVRLNGAVADIFIDWIQKHYPDRAEKVLAMIAELHGGSLSDSRFSTRMRGEGRIAESLNGLCKMARSKYFGDSKLPAYNLSAFRVPDLGGQLSLF